MPPARQYKCATCVQHECATRNTSVSSVYSFLVQVLQQIEEQKINIYQFPDTDYDEEEVAANRRLKVRQRGGRGGGWDGVRV